MKDEFLAWAILYYIRNPGGEDGPIQRIGICETQDIAIAKLKTLCEQNAEIIKHHRAEGQTAHRVYFLRPIVCRVIEEIV